MKTPIEKNTRNIVLVGGDKGGVGKSTVARALAEYYLAKKVPMITYDGDDTNPTFLRFFPDAERLYTKSIKGLEPLINNLEAEKPIQLVDLGAGTSIILKQFAEATGFLDVALSNSADVTFVFVLAPSADSIGLLKNLSEAHNGRLNYLIARNDGVTGTWDLWEESKTKLRLLGELGASEITIPLLDAETFSMIDRHSLAFSAASQDKRLPLACRSYAFRWLQKVHAEFETAKSLLKP